VFVVLVGVEDFKFLCHNSASFFVTINIAAIFRPIPLGFALALKLLYNEI